MRSWITPDGSPGPSGDGGFAAERGRYHLYFCYACPWAHRTLIFRKLKGLEDVISASPVDWYMGPDGWRFSDEHPDPLHGKAFLHQVYTDAFPDYSGRVLVPTRWDRKQRTIVSNESSEIIRMLNSAFDGFGAKPGDYYPQELRPEIDAINECVYHGHLECNLRQLVDYPNLWAYTRELFQWPGVAETVNREHIQKHYYGSHETLNPSGIVPKGPAVDFTAPHGRDALPARR